MNLVDQLEIVVEKLSRPGVLGVAGRQLEKRCERELRVYFHHLGDKVKSLELEKLVESGSSKEMVKHIAVAKLHNTLRVLRPTLLLTLKSNLHDAILAARKHEHVVEAADQPFNKKGESLFDAVKWAEYQAADLVTGLDDTTSELLSNAVAEGLEEQAGVPGTGRLIRDAIEEMSVSRARMIAATEVNRAMSTATMEKLANQDVEYKQIVLSPEACPICEDNAEADPIPIDQDYDSGDGFPPFHPNCRCSITAARAPEGE